MSKKRNSNVIRSSKRKFKAFSKKEFKECLDAGYGNKEIMSHFGISAGEVHYAKRKWFPELLKKYSTTTSVSLSSSKKDNKFKITRLQFQDYVDEGMSLMEIVKTFDIKMSVAEAWLKDIKSGVFITDDKTPDAVPVPLKEKKAGGMDVDDLEKKVMDMVLTDTKPEDIIKHVELLKEIRKLRA
ncbi:hypothetical protein ACTOI6_18900 (plasmid) [Komagataeibacter intermedius]|uniref:hypothetical protein n=1 Tax=Komagataeibacter intermedius TaxID=66229 RepID=UPI00403564FF